MVRMQRVTCRHVGSTLMAASGHGRFEKADAERHLTAVEGFRSSPAHT